MLATESFLLQLLGVLAFAMFLGVCRLELRLSFYRVFPGYSDRSGAAF